ncbi:MAG: sigma-70 family RNA polymerase sigma factor [Lewinellaceae bacterium]|nr:sigma-70 family RNA polymerase sigma factor [Lewinellaceae bacterium]
MIECGTRRFGTLPELLAEVRAGDRAAAGCLYTFLLHQCYPSVRAFLLGKGRPEADAEDFFQEAFLALAAKAQSGGFSLRDWKGRAHSDQLCAYLMQVVKNLWKKSVRWESRPPVMPDEAYSVQEETEYLNHLGWELALKIKEPCRGLLFSRYAQKLSVSEIGKGREPKMNAKAVRHALSGCIQQLLSALNQALERNRQQTELQQLALATVKELEEPCRSLLGSFYDNENKKSMKEIAGMLRYKNANVAKASRVECLKKLQLRIAQKLLDQSS